jgi:hypothetical protein
VSSPPHEGREADRVLQEDPEQRFVGARDLTRWPTAPGAALARAALRLRERLAPHSMLLVILLVGFAVVAVLTVLAGLVYDSVSEKDGVAGLDRPALSAAMAVRTPLGNTLARAYTDIGGTTGMPILATLVAVGPDVAAVDAGAARGRDRHRVDHAHGRRQGGGRTHQASPGRRRPPVRAQPLLPQRPRAELHRACGDRGLPPRAQTTRAPGPAADRHGGRGVRLHDGV